MCQKELQRSTGYRGIGIYRESIQGSTLYCGVDIGVNREIV